MKRSKSLSHSAHCGIAVRLARVWLAAQDAKPYVQRKSKFARRLAAALRAIDKARGALDTDQQRVCTEAEHAAWRFPYFDADAAARAVGTIDLPTATAELAALASEVCCIARASKALHRAATAVAQALALPPTERRESRLARRERWRAAADASASSAQTGAMR